MKRIVAGDFEARLTRISVSGPLGELLHLVNDLIDRCDAYVRESSACMGAVSENSYYRKIIETGMQGNFLIASQTVNHALDTMQNRVSDFALATDNFQKTVGQVVESVASASTELSASAETMDKTASDTSAQAEAVSDAASQASNNVQTVAAASDELTASIQEISHQV
ncbi:MAG: hypothetical protein RID07_09535, partial [Lacipirellulaceae bacterium]